MFQQRQGEPISVNPHCTILGHRGPSSSGKISVILTIRKGRWKGTSERKAECHSRAERKQMWVQEKKTLTSSVKNLSHDFEDTAPCWAVRASLCHSEILTNEEAPSFTSPAFTVCLRRCGPAPTCNRKRRYLGLQESLHGVDRAQEYL